MLFFFQDDHWYLYLLAKGRSQWKIHDFLGIFVFKYGKDCPQKNGIWSVNLDWLHKSMIFCLFFCANPFPAICSSPNSAWHVACFKMDFGHPKETLRVTGYQMNDWVSFSAKLRSGLEPVNFQKLLPSPCGPLTTRIRKMPGKMLKNAHWRKRNLTFFFSRLQDSLHTFAAVFGCYAAWGLSPFRQVAPKRKKLVIGAMIGQQGYLEKNDWIWLMGKCICFIFFLKVLISWSCSKPWRFGLVFVASDFPWKFDSNRFCEVLGYA